MPSEASPQVFRLGDLTLDTASRRLIGPSGVIELRPKTYALLAALARQSGQVVPRQALMAAVWPDAAAPEGWLTKCVFDLRQALGEAGAQQLKTVPGRGYLMDGVRTGPDRLPDPVTTVAPDSIVILPFRSLTTLGDHDRILFDGLAHDMISELARMRSFRVTGRGSSFALRAFWDDPRRLRQLLGTSYAVLGTVVAPAQDGYRVKLDLVRTEDCSLLWTDEVQLDRAVFHQSAARFVERAVASIASQVTQEERRQSLRLSLNQPGQPLAAWEAFHYGLDLLFRPPPSEIAPDDDPLTAAMAHFAAAIRMDPSFARAHAYRSFCTYNLALGCETASRATLVEATLSAARDAMHADSTSPVSHWAFGRASHLVGDPDLGFHHVGRALAICPSFPHAHYTMGVFEAQLGDPHRALEHLEKCETLSPFDPLMAAIQIARATAFVQIGDLETAARWADRASRHDRSYDLLQLLAALILSASGRVEEAATLLHILRGLALESELDRLFVAQPYMPERLRAVLKDGMRRLAP